MKFTFKGKYQNKKFKTVIHSEDFPSAKIEFEQLNPLKKWECVNIN